MKIKLLILLFLASAFGADAKDTWKIYITEFATLDANLRDISLQVSENFQIAFQSCNQRFQVLDRGNYISWIEEAENQEVEENKILLNIQDVDYLVFGNVFYNDYKDQYLIDYALEEVLTGQILILNQLVFNSLEELANEEKRYEKIANKLAEDLDLCGKNNKTKKKKIEKSVSISHNLGDKDKDGVPDVIDQEKDSPEGALVNSRGVAYTKDELSVEGSEITVKSEEEEKKDEMEELLKQMMPEMPSISFAAYTNRVEEETFTQLHQVAKVMEMYPAIKLIVIGNTNNTTELAAYQRAYNTITYLMKHYDIPQKRLMIGYDSLEEEQDHCVAFQVTFDEDVRDKEEPK